MRKQARESGKRPDNSEEKESNVQNIVHSVEDSKIESPELEVWIRKGESQHLVLVITCGGTAKYRQSLRNVFLHKISPIRSYTISSTFLNCGEKIRQQNMF
jgi:hypothetical protein